MKMHSARVAALSAGIILAKSPVNSLARIADNPRSPIDSEDIEILLREGLIRSQGPRRVLTPRGAAVLIKVRGY